MEDLKMPSIKVVKNQLDLLLAKIPNSLLKKYVDNENENFYPKYINKDFDPLELQWRNIDIEIPAQIMPVK